MDFNEVISKELNISRERIDGAVALLDEGKTIPFIARYRKEATGSLDDVQLRSIDTRLQYLRKLEERKGEIRKSIEEQGKMTEELGAKLDAALTLVEAEDIYLPYRPKRKTRASQAIAFGLEPLARIIEKQDRSVDPEKEAQAFLNDDVADTAAALQGAKDILAEEMANNADIRKRMRNLMQLNGVIVSSAADKDAVTPYQNYYEYSEPVAKAAGHRILALNRGEREGALKVGITLDDRHGIDIYRSEFVKNDSPSGQLVKEAAEDSYDRLLFPAVEREVRRAVTENADNAAIKVFAENLRQLLMGAPIKGAVVLGVDPGYRTGCKLAVVDETGAVKETGVAHITLGQGAALEKGKALIRSLMIKHKVTAVSIGNGTASREAETAVADVISSLPHKAAYMVVSEAGASVYSASKLGQDEFPDYDATQRSAVSIARRLQDPLAELVKIDPEAIGVGQYQHDMPKAELSAALDGVVEDCVNSVGVNLNTASYPLLSHIAGINKTIAKNIVAYREENGAFTDRSQLKKVSKLGPKAFEQCAGFLRVSGGKNPLDNTAVHPESYKAAQEILKECGFSLSDLGSGSAVGIEEAAGKIGLSSISENVGLGLPTVRDIIKELAKPGRDPRDELPPPLMRSGSVMELKDLTKGMELVGTVRNIVDFGCFVDCGVHEDGLVHISQLADHYVKNPLDVVKVGQVVKVWVLDVDLKRNRISLTMKKPKDSDKS